MKRIGVLTSGGDAPGMNSCIRAVVRSAIYKGWEVIGIQRGYAGLIENDVQMMSAHSVSNIIYRGGTVLKSARSKEFMKEEGQRKAVENIRKLGMQTLIVVGGDGSLEGARVLDEKWDIPTIGIPAVLPQRYLPIAEVRTYSRPVLSSHMLYVSPEPCRHLSNIQEFCINPLI